MSGVPPDDRALYRFGVFELDPAAQELHKAGRLVRVRPQSLRLLTLLLSHPGQMVTREDIQQALWGREVFVDFDQGVNHCVRELRTALADAAETPRFIQTLPRRGYRFIAPVERVEVATAPAPIPASPPGRVTVESTETRDDDHQTAAGLTSAGAAPAILTGVRSRWRRSIMSAAAVVVFALLVGVVYTRSRRPPLSASPAIVVRPFSTQSEQALGIGLAQAISARLGGLQTVSIRQLRVGSDGKGATGANAGTAAGALLLDGDLSVSGDDVVAVVRLTNGDGGEVWSDRYVARAEALFSIEDVIAERVVTALRLRIAAAEQARLRRRYTTNAAAYEDYLRGRAALVKYTPEGTAEAVRAFESALSRDPEYALARAGLAMACADMYLRFARAGEVEGWGERADAESRAALALDGELAEAHLASAAVARKREFDWDMTVTASRRALLLNSNLDQAHFFMSAAYYHLGYMEEALIAMEKGRALQGADAIEPVRIQALVALFSGNFGPARVHLEEVSRLSSRTIGDTYLALAYYYSGSGERGRTMLSSLATDASASTAARAGAAFAGVLAAEGDAAGARREIQRVLARDYRDHHVAYGLGAAYAQLGDIAEAVRWMRIAADTGFPCVIWLERDPLWEPLRLRSEFADVLTYVRSRREQSLSKTH